MSHSPFMTYFILADFGPGIGPSYVDTEPATSFRAVLERLADYDKIDAVWCADAQAGSWTDVTEDVAHAVAKQLHDTPFDDLAPCKRDLLERFDLAPAEDEFDGLVSEHEHQRREAVMMGHFS